MTNRPMSSSSNFLNPEKKAEYRHAGTTEFRGTRVLEILRDALQPGSETKVESAVKAILKFTPDAPLSDEVNTIGEVVLEIAQQIPYHHPSHVKLANAMEEFTTSPQFMTGPYAKGQYMRGQRFKELLRDAYNGPSGENPQEWPNIMAFYAHMSATHIVPHNPTWAIWTMRDAFEERAAKYGPMWEGEKDQRVIAAAQFIFWDGLELFKHALCPDLDEERASWEPGLLCFCEARLSRRRWNFWRDDFKEAADDTDLSDECRKVAGKAKNLMVAIEDSLAF